MRVVTSLLPAKLASAGTMLLFFALSSQGGSVQPNFAQKTKTTEEFMRAARNGNLYELRILLSKGVHIAVTDDNYENALVWATDGGQLNTVNFLLAHGVSARDKNGCAALFTAVDEGQTNIVKALLLHGADINARDTKRDNATPLMIACFYDTGGEGAVQYPNIVQLLLRNGADVTAKDNYGRTALTYLKSMPNSKIHKMLLAARARG